MGKRVGDVLSAGVLFSLLGIARLFPPERASAIGGRLARRMATGLLDRPSTRRTIATAFPELDAAGQRHIIEGMADQLGRMVAEMSQLDRLDPFFETVGREHIDAARALGKPVLVVSGHFGNFEAALIGLRRSGLDCAILSRPMNNPLIERWAVRNRIRAGVQAFFPKSPEGTRRMLAHIRKGGDVALLIDQRLDEGVPAPLFGHEVMTADLPATLAVRGTVTLLPAALRRREDGFGFTEVFHPPLLPPNSGNEEADILSLTAAINRFVEGEVRARPAHWLWMHDRFKRPAALSRRANEVMRRAGAGETDRA